MKKNPTHFLKLAGLALILLAGCESARENMRKQAENDAFLPEDNTRAYRRFALAQEAVGARHDGMLYSYHFDGDQLNSLGEHKLTAMLGANDRAFPVVVYLNCTEESLTDKRKQAVATYFLDCGLQDQQFRFEVGHNPNATSSGAQNLARLSKTESESPVASNPTNQNAPGGGTGGGGGGAGDLGGK
jgi:hypothetical protein